MRIQHIFLLLLLYSCLNNIYADDPYCKRSFNGKIIITNKSGGAIYESPSLKSELLMTLDYAQVVEGCIWNTYRDTINKIPGNWRKVKVQDMIGFVFSTDGYSYDSASFSEEKIVRMAGYGPINYSLTNNFYGIFETPNGDSLLHCNIQFERYSCKEIIEYNEHSYNELTPEWHSVLTDKPYECKLLFATKQTYSPQRIDIVTYKSSTEESGSFEIEIANSLTSRFNSIRQDSIIENGNKIFDSYHLLVKSGENRNVDTVYTCRNCSSFSLFTVDFIGDINKDRINDFLFSKLYLHSTKRFLFISQGSNSKYRISDE